MTDQLIRPAELPRWVPGTQTLASPESGWDGMSVRGYRYTESDVGVPPMRDYLIVAYTHGVTRMDREVEGRWKHEDLGPGDASLLTRAAQSHWHWPEDIEVVHVYLTAGRLAEICADVYERDVASVELRDVLKAADPDLHRTAMLIADEARQGGIGRSMLRRRPHVPARHPDPAAARRRPLPRAPDRGPAERARSPNGDRLHRCSHRRAAVTRPAGANGVVEPVPLRAALPRSDRHLPASVRHGTSRRASAAIAQELDDADQRRGDRMRVLGSESHDADLPTTVRVNPTRSPIGCIDLDLSRHATAWLHHATQGVRVAMGEGVGQLAHLERRDLVVARRRRWRWRGSSRDSSARSLASRGTGSRRRRYRLLRELSESHAKSRRDDSEKRQKEPDPPFACPTPCRDGDRHQGEPEPLQRIQPPHRRPTLSATRSVRLGRTPRQFETSLGTETQGKAPPAPVSTTTRRTSVPRRAARREPMSSSPLNREAALGDRRRALSRRS